MGAWQITPSIMLPDGTNRIFAKAVDSAGNVSVATADTNLVISAATPDLTMGRLSGDNILTLTDLDSGAYASGYVTPGSAVTVSIAGRDMLATVQANGRWSYQLTEDDYDAVGVADNGTITATATGANGSTTSAKQGVNFRTEKTAIPANPEMDGGLVKTSAGQAGSVFGKAQINANALVINSAQNINVRSNVTSADLTAGGNSMFLSNAGALELNAAMASGEMAIRAGGTMVIHEAIFTSDVLDNAMEFMSGDTGIWDGEEAALRRRLANVGLTETQINDAVAEHNFVLDGVDMGLTGGVLIDLINAGTQGDVVIKSSGDVREVLKDDAGDILFDLPAYAPGQALGPQGTVNKELSTDVYAKSFTAIGRNHATTVNAAAVTAVSQLEFSDALIASGNNISLDWAQMPTATVLNTNSAGVRDGVYALAGYFSTDVDISFADGLIDVVGLHVHVPTTGTGNVSLSAKEVTVAGTIRAEDEISITGGTDGVLIKEGAYLASQTGDAISISTDASDITMRSGALIKTTGAASLTSTSGDITLGRILSANPALDLTGGGTTPTSGSVTVSTGGQILDGDTRSVGGVEVANIETNGTISLSADGGIGAAGNGIVVKSDVVDSLSAGTGNIVANLQSMAGTSVTVKALDANNVTLGTNAETRIGASSSDAGFDIAGNFALTVASGDVIDNAALAVDGTTTLNVAGNVTIDNAATNLNGVVV
ncbi:MAG: hypothetical protein VW891_13920, partial [Novosphingobium sp.]